MGDTLKQYVVTILLGIVSSIFAYLVIKRIEKNPAKDLSEYKTLPFYLGIISVVCSIIALIGFTVSIIALWKNGKLLLLRKTKAYVISFFLSILALTLSSVNSTMGGFYIWYHFDHVDPVFNTSPRDNPLLRVLNRATTPPNLSYDSPNFWRQVVTAKLDDTITFTLWYHNTSERDTKDVHLRFDYNQYGNLVMCGAALNEEFYNNVVLGHSAIYISEYTGSLYYRLDFIKASWFPDQKLVSMPFPYDQSGSEIMTPQGLNIGIIEPGNWQHQGTIAFDVVIHRRE